MKIALRNIATGLFLARGGQWSANPKEARGFLDAVRARDHKVYCRLSDTVVVALPENVVTLAEKIVCEALAIANWQLESREGPIQMKMKEPTLKMKPNRKVVALPTLPKSVKACASTKSGINTAYHKLQESPRAAESITEIEAKIDVGWGNALFIRGNGAGLTWDKGVPLTCFNGSRWVWLTPASDKVIFKLLLNDQIWAEGADLVVEPGSKVELQPIF
jgi:hypothetical protein